MIETRQISDHIQTKNTYNNDLQPMENYRINLDSLMRFNQIYAEKGHVFLVIGFVN